MFVCVGDGGRGRGGEGGERGREGMKNGANIQRNNKEQQKVMQKSVEFRVKK